MGIAIANRKNRCDFGALSERKHNSHRGDGVLWYFLRPEFGQFSPDVCGGPLLNHTEKLEKLHKNALEKIQNSNRDRPRNCRMLSHVVLDRPEQLFVASGTERGKPTPNCQSILPLEQHCPHLLLTDSSERRA